MGIQNNESISPTVLITGAGRRLGLFLAQYYLKVGWRVLAHYNTNNEMPQVEQDHYSQQGLYCALQADLTCAAQAKNLVSAISQLGWKFDSIIHNASYFAEDDSQASSAQGWQLQQDMMAVHVFSVEVLTIGLLSSLNLDSSIIAITDIYADKPNQRFSSYCAAKAALQNLSLSYSQRLAPAIRVNVIQPGPIQFLPGHDDSYRQKVLSQSLLKTELGYDSILQGIIYLQQAQGVTGTILKIDGGRSNANHYEQVFTTP